MLSVDLNADMGEGMSNDSELMRYISSANIACGVHAGDEETMKKTVQLALSNKVSIGAHFSYPDRENFGREDMKDQLSSLQLSETIRSQILHLKKIAEQSKVQLRHVKAHGALYNRAAIDQELSELICEVVASIDQRLIFFGLSGSLMEKAALSHGLKYVHEVFADRNYENNATLTPRREADAMILDLDLAIERALQMVKSNTVNSRQGKLISIKADSICIHGDEPGAAVLAKKLRQELETEGIAIQSCQPGV